MEPKVFGVAIKGFEELATAIQEDNFPAAARDSVLVDVVIREVLDLKRCDVTVQARVAPEEGGDKLVHGE